MVGIIVLNYNNIHDTINCINSVLKYNTAPAKIIVVDNGSSKAKDIDILEDYLIKISKEDFIKYNNLYSAIPTSFPAFSLIVSSKNLGYANGNNLALHYVNNDSEIDDILILNNDVLFVEDILPLLKKKSEELPFAAILSPILYTKDLKNIDYTCARKAAPNWRLIWKFIFFDLNLGGITKKIDAQDYLIQTNLDILKKDAFEIELPSGSCMFLKKNIFKQINWFDPNTFLYYEEMILHKKISSIKKKNYLLPQIKCIHLGASTTRTEPSFFLIKCSFDSAIYYLKNYADLSLFQRLFLYLGILNMSLKLFIFKYIKKK